LTLGDFNELVEEKGDLDTLGLGLAVENLAGLGVATLLLPPLVLTLSLASSRRRAAGDMLLSLSFMLGDALPDRLFGEGMKNL